MRLHFAWLWNLSAEAGKGDGRCHKEDSGEQQKGGKEIDLNRQSFRPVLYLPLGPADYAKGKGCYAGKQIIFKAGKGQSGCDGKDASGHLLDGVVEHAGGAVAEEGRAEDGATAYEGREEWGDFFSMLPNSQGAIQKPVQIPWYYWLPE